MKKLTLISFGLVLTVCAKAQSQGTGIGTISPDASSQLDVTSTTKGFLPPRMDSTQRNAINNPAAGLVIYNTSTGQMEVNTGTAASPVWSSTKSGTTASTTLTSATSPAGTSVGQMMYNTGSTQPTGLIYWDGTQWKSVASSGGNTTNNYTVVNNKTVTNNDSVINNNPVINNDTSINNGPVYNTNTVTNGGSVTNNGAVTNNSTSTFNGAATFNKKAVFNDTAVFSGGMKVSNLPQGLPTDSILVFEPTTKVMRRISVANATASAQPWYKVGTTSGATANTDDVYLSGKVGIGTNTPSTTLHVSSTGNYGVNIERTAAAGAAPRLHFYKNNGTVIGSPAAVTNGSVLGAIDFYAYNGTSYPAVGNPGASIFSLATEDQTASAKGTSLAFKTNANGSASSAERMRIDHNGNVGIGTTSPISQLHVDGGGSGSVRATNLATNAGLLFSAYANAAYVQYEGTAGSNTSLNLSGRGGGNPDITINGSTGYVGVGTSSPIYRLDVRDDVDGLARFRFQNASAGANNRSDIAVISNGNGLYMGVDNGGTIYGSGSKSYMDNRSGGRLVFGSNSVEQMTVTTDGRVGIGTSTPQAPLHIGGIAASSFSTGPHSYITFGTSTVGTGASSGPRTDASVIAEGLIWSKAAIVSAQSITFSDRRIKNIIGQSNASKDLDLLNKIRITDYRMKDVVKFGNKQYKKVIAQEVEEVYPDAITQQTDFVPNIYQPADKVENLGNNTYRVSFKNKVEYNSNVTGDLKLFDEHQEITAKVVSKADHEIVFTTTDAVKGDKLFLYGEEVTDFRAVDYEALSTLNISATQELYRKMQAQQQEIESLKRANAGLTASIEDTKKLEGAYAQLAAQVREMQQAMGIPVASGSAAVSKK